MLSLNHPYRHVLSWFDDVTTHTPTMLPAVVGFQCSVCLCLHRYWNFLIASAYCSVASDASESVLREMKWRRIRYLRMTAMMVKTDVMKSVSAKASSSR